MSPGPTRREFLKTAGAAGSLLALASDRVEAAASPANGGPLDQGVIDAQLQRRARQHFGQRRLVVDYYRVGRKLAYPLPVPSLSIPEVVVPGIADYPWTVWMLWALEERILLLGWAAEWFHDPDAARAAGADLEALARWPEYRQYPKPDLGSAHAGRILWNAVTRWHWPDESLRRSLHEACRRHAESVLGAADKFFGAVQDKNDIVGRESPHELLQNIPVIGAIVAAMTAAVDAHYAAVLRSGWQSEDLAVAVSCSTSPMGHLQADSGTLVLGTRGRWLIADPGYQQYAPGDERDFTLGPTAHNAPLINGQAVSQKRPRRVALEETDPGLRRLGIELTACYPPAAAIGRCVRHVWLSGRELAVVADQVEARRPPQVKYHWHGHPAAAWWFEEGWAMLLVEGLPLWFSSPQLRLRGAHLHRLPGSRGQLTLMAAIESAPSVVWWAFAVGPERPAMRLAADGRELIVRDRRFAV